MMKAALSIVSVALCLALPTNAFADRFDTDPEIPDGRVRASLMVGHTVTEGGLGEVKSLVLAPQLMLDYRALSSLLVHIHVPTSHVDYNYDNGGFSTFELANIEFGASFITRLDNGLVLRLGGNLAVPTASESGNALSVGLARDGTAKSHGLWDVWQQVPDRLTVISSNSLTLRAGSFRGVAHLDIGFLIPTAGDVGDNFTVIGQAQLDAAYRNKVIEVGVSLRGVFTLVEPETLPGTSSDLFQGSVAPFFKAFISGGFLDLRFNINLDEPAGVSFENGGWWGVDIGIGVFL